MDPGTGAIFETSEVIAKKFGLVPVKRDLTEAERMRMQIALYSPCGCGSGKKFKFCCRQHRVDELRQQIATAAKPEVSPP